MTVLILVCALLAALATTAVAVVFALQTRRNAAELVRDEAERFVRALGRTGELAASLDHDEVVARTLDAVAALPGVDAAIIEVANPSGEQVRTARGMPDEDAAHVPLQTPANANLRAMDVAYRYRLDDADRAASLLRAGLVVPLAADGGVIGTLAAFTRTASSEFPAETVVGLERLAQRTGQALGNAHRFAQARLHANVDSLTGLQNRRRFHELLATEVARARRYERQLALIVFDLDDFKAINDRVGHLSGDQALAEVARRVRAVVRAADVACRVGGDEFGVIMPESSLGDARLLAERITRTVAERPLDQGDTLHVSAGVAALKPEDGPDAFFERADDALYQAKQSGKDRTVAAG